MNPRNVWPSELNTNDFVPTGTAHCRVESTAHIAKSHNSSTSKREMKKQALERATRGLVICLVMSISKTATVTLPRTSSTVLFERLHFLQLGRGDSRGRFARGRPTVPRAASEQGLLVGFWQALVFVLRGGIAGAVLIRGLVRARGHGFSKRILFARYA